ncbi:MAG: hypothetical protein VW450_02685 [Chloroflexota bacterium]
MATPQRRAELGIDEATDALMARAYAYLHTPARTARTGAELAARLALPTPSDPRGFTTEQARASEARLAQALAVLTELGVLERVPGGYRVAAEADVGSWRLARR